MKKHTLLLACAMRILLNLIALPSRGRLTIRRSNFSVIPIAPRSLMIKKAMPINGHRLFDCQAYLGCIILEDGYIAMIQKKKW